jgi:hypothetical protein
MLRKRNENYGTIKFVDISSENYSAEENSGIDFETVYVEFGKVIKKLCFVYERTSIQEKMGSFGFCCNIYC